ncbi:MAG: protein phosphatase 2C domain-containing protein [Parachlamydiales bacterium]|jgi:protein phosphatase
MAQIEAYGISDIGNVRKKNEDVFKILESHKLFSIADGMGGHKAGDVAANEATNHLCNLLARSINHDVSIEQIIEHIRLAILEANDRVFNLSKTNDNFFGMGTTLCCLYLHHVNAIFAHVGDSRIYHYNNKDLIQLTKDHSLINKLKDQNKVFNPQNYKNIITKAIGTHDKVEPSIGQTSYRSGDVFLLCTDGLSDNINDDILKKNLSSSISSQAICENLINEAKNNKGSDNITALVIKIIKV